MNKKTIKSTESSLRRIIRECIERVLKEEIGYPIRHYSYYNRCSDMDAEEVQEITHWDEYAETNDYAIQDDYWNSGYFLPVPIDDFLNMVQGEYHPNPNQIEYCMLNQHMDILFCLTKKGIHYFYE